MSFTAALTAATECVTGPGTAGTVDALVLRDILGQTREARIPRDTCHAATTGLQDAVATAQLLHVTDALLGPPT